MKRRDIIIIAVLVVAALVGLYFTKWQHKDDLGKLVITQDTVVISEIHLNANTNESFRIENNGEWNDVVITNGVVDVTDANCPNLNCVHTVPASHIGDMIVCLPHHLTLEILPEE